MIAVLSPKPVSGGVLRRAMCVAGSVLLAAPGPASVRARAESVPCRVTADSTHSRFGAVHVADGNASDPESRWASAKTPGPHHLRLRFPTGPELSRIDVVAHAEPDLVPAAVELRVIPATEPGDVFRVSPGVTAPGRFSAAFPAQRIAEVVLDFPRGCLRDGCVRIYEVECWLGDERLTLAATGGPEDRGVPPLRQPVTIGQMRPFPAPPLASGGLSGDPFQEMLAESVLAWGRVLSGRYREVPGKPDCGYYGLGGHREDDIRPIAYAVRVHAYLCSAPERGGPRIAEAERDLFRRQAVGALRYLCGAHVTGGGRCADGSPWGNDWQSAMWAQALGLGAWMLADDLDPELLRSALSVVSAEADRFTSAFPKSSEFADTGAEENAWNAGILSLAACMLPGAPQASEWDRAAKRYLYNCLSLRADASSLAAGDDGFPISRWVTTVNAHDDFTVENHGLVHVGYLKNTLAMMAEAALPYLLCGEPVPGAARHHYDDALGVLYSCMTSEGVPVYFGGNDWKIVHTQAADLPLYTFAALGGDRSAAHIEHVAGGFIGPMQAAESGFYNVRRDLEYGGLCATRVLSSLQLRGYFAGVFPPRDEAAFMDRATGVRRLPSAQAILHRMPGKFASFTWGPRRLALAMPADGTSFVWPHLASGLGYVGGEDASARLAPMDGVREEVRADGFGVRCRLLRCRGRVAHAVSFESPGADLTVYVERLATVDGDPLPLRQTGVVGHEYPPGVNVREVYGPFGRYGLTGVGEGREEPVEFPGTWLNVANAVGYVIAREAGRANVMRYRDLARGEGRVPKLQEWFSLVGDPPGASYAADWACIVTLLNRTAEETRRVADGLRFTVEGDRATVRVDGGVYHAVLPVAGDL